MSNIIGEGFPPEIIKQIKTRQSIIGSVNRTNEQLTFFNTKTGWCKLVSSVKIIKKLRDIPVDPDNNKLASRFVLFNGTTNESPTTGALETYQRGGIWPGIGNSNDYAYGIGGTNYGLRPMPGIISATIKTESNGSIKSASIVLQANNREQFDIIDVLYMRLGFTMLLEWGNSSYFETPEKYIADNKNSLADKFLTGELQYNTALDTINNQRLESCGNYDAMIGTVVNFSWTFTKDGKYDITLKLIGAGAIIESLKINTLLPDTTAVLIKAAANKQLIKTASADAAKEISNDIKNGTQDKVDYAKQNYNNAVGKEKQSTASNNLEFTDSIESFRYTHQIGKYFYLKYQELKPPVTPTNPSNGIALLKDAKDNNKINFFSQTYKSTQVSTGGKVTPIMYYIRLGHFLEYLQTNITPEIDNGGTTSPQLKYFTDYKKNIIYLNPYQISNDPGVCVFNTTRKFEDDENTTYHFAPGTEQFEYKLDSLDTKYGYIMNSYFNMEWILTQLDALKNVDTGKVTLLNLLKALCNGWNTSTGNSSMLFPTIDIDTNEVRITDQTSLPNRDKILVNLGLSTEQASFDTYGYNNWNSGSNQSGGFIRDLSFQTSVTPNLVNMITIGATQNGYVVGQDATALSRMNNGLLDTFKPKIKSPNTVKNDASYSTGSLNEDYKDTIRAYNTFIKELGSKNNTYPTYNTEAITNFIQTAVSLTEYDQAAQTIADNLNISKDKAATTTKDEIEAQTNDNLSSSPNSGFLPFNLSITMDGLSGMKIFQKYKADVEFLPKNYPTSLEFIINGISNTIQNNEWTTTLDSFAIPKNPYGAKPSKNTTLTTKPIKVVYQDRFKIPTTKTNIVKKIIKYAQKRQIYDIPRLTAILAVAQAESGLTPSKTENFTYSISSARETFSWTSRLQKLSDSQILNLLPPGKYNGKGSQKRFADYVYGGFFDTPINGGYEYRGRGLTQITFKGNYDAIQKVLKFYKTGYDEKMVNNPDIVLDEDIGIAILVLGKIQGTFGFKLEFNNPLYLTDGLTIQSLQNGTNGKGNYKSNSVTKNYILALDAINNTEWIQKEMNTIQ